MSRKSHNYKKSTQKFSVVIKEVNLGNPFDFFKV